MKVKDRYYGSRSSNSIIGSGPHKDSSIRAYKEKIHRALMTRDGSMYIALFEFYMKAGILSSTRGKTYRINLHSTDTSLLIYQSKPRQKSNHTNSVQTRIIQCLHQEIRGQTPRLQMMPHSANGALDFPQVPRLLPLAARYP